MPSRTAGRTTRWLVVLLCLANSTLVLAQGTGGRILGRVADPTAAVLAGVKVTLVNEAAGNAHETQTNDTGDYVFPQVAVGTYRLEFDLTGFKKAVQRGVSVDLNQVLTVNMVMQIGAAQETLEVTSAAPLVDATTTQLGAVVDDRSVAGLPLNSRDTYQLLQLQPGVQGTGGSDLFAGSSGSGAVSVNGGRGRANNFSVNGGDANDLFINAPAIQPSPDSIQEFRVITNSFDAEYGRNSGAVVNVVTKSGTNQFHGDVYEFIRNNSFNAKGYLDPFRPDSKQNQFGGTFGGPIRKDHTFIFGSYEGRRTVEGVTSDPVVVPTAAERSGDFSGSPFGGSLSSSTLAAVLQNRNGCAAAISAAGGNLTNPAWTGIFPNSKIPTACFDPVAANLLRFVPSPNNPNDIFGTSLANIHQSIPDGREQDDQFTIRFDHHINNAQTFNAYYYFLDSRQSNPFTRFEALTPNLLEGFGNNGKTRSQQWNLAHEWAVNNSSVNEFRFTYFRNAQRTYLHPQRTNNVIDSCTGSAVPFCFTGTTDTPGVFTSNPKMGITPGLGPNHEGVPFITLSSGFTIGNDYEGELPQVGNTFQWSDNFTKVKGNHTMKFGVDVRRARFDQTLFFDPNGDFTYSGGGPNDFIATNPDGTQNLFPNYLLGLPDSYLQGSTQTENVRATSIYLFAQDSFKIKPNLTLNYGLRWELNTPLADISGRVQTFRPGQTSTEFPCQLSAGSIASFTALGVANPNCANTGTVPVGLVVPGDKGIPPGMTSTYYKAFAPRLGLAYSPNWGNNWLTGGPGKTSIRMGWGMFYNPIEQLVLEQLQGEPPFGGSTTISEGFFTTPFAAQNCNMPCGVGTNGVAPNPFGGILNPPRGQPVDWSRFRPILLFGEIQPNMRSQYADQYNLTLQRELRSDVVLQVAYVGSQGHRLLGTRDINFSNPQSCLDLNATLGAGNCGPFGEDFQFIIPVGTKIAPQGLHLPYGPNGPTFIPGGTIVNATNFPGLNPNGIDLVGLRPFSSPLCNPITNNGCPPDGVPVFASIFSQNTTEASNYNSLQVSVEKRTSHGLQLLAAYTYSKSIDSASTFEEVLNPLNERANRSLSLFDARHRLVLSYVWEPPIPKFNGAKGKLLNGWEVSGITSFQSGFPIRILSNNDQELMNSFDFNLPGKPDVVAPFQVLNPKTNNGFYFNTSSFALPVQANNSTPAQLFGNAPRAICCGPGINNFDFSFHKLTPINERFNTEFRAELFNAFNRTQFTNPDGNFSDGAYFGRVLHTRDPRQIQFAVKLLF
jgi:hypothetical protein